MQNGARRQDGDPVPGCKATPFTLNITMHFDQSHPKTNMADYDISDWVVKAQAHYYFNTATVTDEIVCATCYGHEEDRPTVDKYNGRSFVIRRRR